MMKEPIKVAADNRRARHDYFIDETYEAGIALAGTEVKSIRAGKVSLRDSYADVQNGEVFLQNMHISPYDKGGRFNHDPKRPRKLLMHKREIKRLFGQTTQKGYTLIPLRLYFKTGKVKVELALARGKKLYDKRQDIAQRDAQREIDRALSNKRREW
ncbi:MAG: SsrA-binding protein SmpB [Syntrophaceticus sp.]|nr:SsrA-binding protein SmpB [Syntrophaceticus sp.]MDD3315041.1 SsrA-binding protein SmpB [Syntrophaceticus sp.]MDD4359958.1 SsrA-binding protein SmpB [Syntrophaceticus sp.]MDD4782501.1 SsrA-binding protein SmpB [Syntrophaceticus sp.]HBI27909.1 SsrA-binding protein [Peptococcaceae bacterium]